MRTPLTVAVLIGAILFASGCGGSASHQAAVSPSHEAAASPSSPAAPPSKKSGTEASSAGEMIPRYEDAQSPEAEHGRQLMTDAKFLEDVAHQVNDILVLPFDVPVVGRQCGEDNAYWSPSAKEITICYEDINHTDQLFTRAADPNPVAGAVNAEISTFYHELGHATLSIYELPFTGREEDVADQLSAFMLLTPGADGKPYPNGVQIATDAARMWKLNAHEAGDANDLPFWDSHSFDLTRMYNWECWIYGSDPAANGDIVTSGDLPDGRAGGCEEEFQKMSAAWQQMLGPHLRKPS